MPISHGHRPFDYNEFVPEMGAKDLITAVELKQNLYDQGVAQIQAQIDAYSTLPLIRDADKRYMNQELDKYYQVIKSNVGSTDFSNPNAVKSFLDIARPMENDPIIKNAIESTNEYLNRRKTLDDIRTNKPHLYSPANEWDYMNDAGKWIEDQNPGTKLNHKYYKPSLDIAKRFGDFSAKMKPNIESEMNKAGGFISEEQRTFLTAEKLKNGFMASLSPQELEQLDIDARYHASTLSPEQKYNQVVRHYSGLQDTYTTLGNIKGIENTGTTSQDYLRNAAALKEVTDALRDPKTGYVNEDYLDRLYANMYTQNWAQGQGEAYEYSQTKTKWETNPYSLSAYNATLQLKNYKDKYDYKLDQDFEQMKRTGELIQNSTGQWVQNPNYKPKTSTRKTAPLGMMSQNLSDENVKTLLNNGQSYTLDNARISNQTSQEFQDWLVGELLHQGVDQGDIEDKNGTLKVEGLTISKKGDQLEYKVTVGGQTRTIIRGASGVFNPTDTAIPGTVQEESTPAGSGVTLTPSIESEDDTEF